MNELQKKISDIGVVPVIKLSNPQRDAKPLADALCAGGVPVAEVTFRAAGAADAIRIMAESHPEMMVGAGTVMTTEQVDRAVAAGAAAIVSPGLSPAVARICNEIIPIAMSYPAGWLMCSLLTIVYYRKVSLNKTKLVEDN